MSAFQLKIIAIAVMAFDHIGLYFFPDMLFLRMIGRISFPIFAWLVANGAYYTHNIKLYLIRLFLLACISQPLFYLANVNIDPSSARLNVVFTLFIGLAAIISVSKTKNRFLWVIVIVLFATTANVIQFDYGAMGVLSIVFFYIFYNKRWYLWLSQVIVYVVGYWMWRPFVQDGQFYVNLLQYIIQLFALFSLFLIGLYNGREGLRAKYLFYVVYPLQYVAIYFLQKVVLR